MEFHLKSLREAIEFCQTKKTEAETANNRHEVLSYTQLEHWLKELYAMRGAFDQAEQALAKIKEREWIK